MTYYRHICFATALLVFIASFTTACNNPSSEIKPIASKTLLNQLKSGQQPLILDVRSPSEYSAGHVPKAINIPHTQLETRINEVMSHKERPVVVYCKSGVRAGKAGKVLLQTGFTNIQHLEGDMDGWITAKYPIAK